MASSPFTLSPVDIVNWQGTPGNQATIRVVATNTTIQITLEDVFYPGSTNIPVAGDTVSFALVTGSNDHSVSIKPRTVPPIVWNIVEVGTDGTTQILAAVNDPDPQQDPYSTSIRIIGQGNSL